MRNVKEKDINIVENWIVFPHPKEGKPKHIHLLQEDAQLIREHWQEKGEPNQYFFRHIASRSGIQVGDQFGKKYFRKYWKKACETLGVDEVLLYAGTKHTTVTALGKSMTPEQIKRSVTGHVSKAFERYFLPDVADANHGTEMIKLMQGDQPIDSPVVEQEEVKTKGNVISFSSFQKLKKTKVS
jgi:hypothetical protein